MSADPPALLLMVNGAFAVFSGTWTVCGTVATFVLVLFKVTMMPPAGATLLSVTPPLTARPASTGLGLSEMARTVTPS